jgi:hypothetical protein
MRVFSYVLMLVGFCLLCAAGYDQYRGVTGDPSRWGASGIAWGKREFLRQQDPIDFRNAMVFRWGLAIVIFSGGLSLYRSIRRDERLDPLSPEFDWKDEP